LAGIFTLVVAGIIAVIVVDRNPVPSVPASPPIEKPRDDLPGQFMASLTRDLETAKAAGKSQEKIQLLAGIMEQATRELTWNNVDHGPSNPQRFSWYNRLLAVGSKESIELATVLREQEARQLEDAVAKYLSDGDNTGKSATQKIMEAKTPADIDPIIRQLKDFTESAPSREASESTVRKELLCLLDFANSWQLQLAQRAAGQSQLALKTLQSIAQSNKIPRWLDRSVFLREIEVASRTAGKIPLEEIEPRITEIANKALAATTSEELDQLLLAGGKLQESLGNDDLLRIPFSQLNEFLKNLQNAIIALENHETATLRSLLILLESHHPDFDRHLGVPRTHLLRISLEERQALDSFVYGMRQENDAKDFRTATMAYQSVLTNSSTLIPPAQVGARLENLRQNHPKEYESGIDDALNLNKGESRVLPGARPKQLVWAIPARKPL
jgi:hypothetical protein